jgi:hypothetical protein
MAKRFLIFILGKLMNLPSRFNEWILIKFFQRHLKYELIKVGKISASIIILAVFPGTTSLFSLKRMLDSIIRTNYSVFVVINNNSKTMEVLKLLESYDCTVIVRPNIGRDIGAYQSAFHFLEKNSSVSNFERVALLNDSLYVTSKTADFYFEFLMSDRWNCVYMNMQGTHHASSHSLIFDEKALSSKKFQEFWRTYYPSSSRMHSIYKGEFGITHSLGEDYFKPLFNPQLISNSNTHIVLSELEKSQIRIWSALSGFEGYELITENLITEQFVEVLLFCLENFQISNSIGLFLHRFYGVPIKLDICTQKLVSRDSFIRLLDNGEMTPDESMLLRRIVDPSTDQFTSESRYSFIRTLARIRKMY